MPKKIHKSSSGFTLVEVIVSLLIMALITAIALPIPSTMEKRYLQKALSELKSDIEYIQSMEQTTGNNYVIGFQDNGTYGVYANSVLDKPQKWVTPTGIKQVTKNNGMTVQFTNNGTTESGSTTIVFYTKNFLQDMTISLGTGHVDIKTIRSIPK